MPKRLFRPPAHLVKQWPEVFGDLYMNSMPLAYLKELKIEFKDGRIWQFSIMDMMKTHGPDDVLNHLLKTIEEYENQIVNIDFDLNIEKLKKDIKQETKKIL